MPTIIENFETVNEDNFYSYSDQDIDFNSWELINGNLRLYGNTWKEQINFDIPITNHTVWQVSSYLDNDPSQNETSELQGFGIEDNQGNKLKYIFGGSQQADESFEWVYQGAFSIKEWNEYQLPIGKDFERRY